MNGLLIGYQSANITNEESINSFIVRTEIFERVIGSIRQTNINDSLQHYVLVGRRGSGKSTLLRRIEAEILTDKKLYERFIVVNLSEEQAGIYKLYDLWDQVIQTLKSKDFIIEELKWQEYQDNLKEYTKQLYIQIHDCLKETGKQLVLLVDNIDRIFKNIGEDAHLLRELLMNFNEVRIIGASTIMAEDFWNYGKPFYQYFSPIVLQSLTIEEVQNLLEYWAEKMSNPEIATFLDKQPGKLQAIRMLTDGTPRTMLLFVKLLINRPEQNGFEYLRAILDKATPVYQERLGLLSPQQQKIVLELSFFWESVKVEDLVSVCKMQSKTISAQLNQLTKQGIVEKVKGKGKNLYYRLSERFFNLWLLMTQGGPAQKQQVKYLTIFLENWYDKTELKEIYERFHENLSKGTLKPEYAASMTKALAHSRYLTILERDSLLEVIQKMPEIKKEWLSELPEKATSILKKALSKLEKNQFNSAITTVNLIEQDDPVKNSILGFSYYKLDKMKEAEYWYLKACDDGDVTSMLSLSYIYYEKGEIDKAIDLTSKAAETGNVDALNNMGILLENNGQIMEAKKWYEKAISKGNNSAMNNLGVLYKDEGDFEKAEKYFLLAVDTGYKSALINLGSIYWELEKIDEAMKWFNKALEQNLPQASYNMSGLYYTQNQKKEEAYKLIKDYLAENPNGILAQIGYLVISLWAGEFSKFQENVENTFQKALEEDPDVIGSFVLNLLIHKQYNLVKKWFSNEEFGNKLKGFISPIYYALLSLSDDSGSALLKIPPELEESVSDVVSHIRDLQEFYYGSKA